MRASAALCVAAACWLAACAPRDLYLGADLPDASQAGGGAGADAGPRETATAGAGSAAPPVAGSAPEACRTGREDCDGNPQNGCETDVTSDAAHCGACGRACQGPDCVCRDGQFQVRCLVGRADCDGNPQNGCEVDTQTSMDHCGACSKRCHTGGHDAIAAVCMSGRCHITCQVELAPEGDCDGNPDNGCETSLWSNDNCGACGVRCVCSAGVCR